MGYRNRELHGQEIAVPASFSDALLFTTMCIIGLPVDVHVKDGSVYSGLFHTACVENDYGIVLKKARMTKKGNRNANVVIGDLIETLVVVSEDLVQVVAKEISLPTDGVACNVAGGDIVGTIPSLECADRGVKIKNYNKANMDRMQISQTRRPHQVENGIANGFAPTIVRHVGNALIVENGKSDGIDSMKNEEASSTQINGRQVGDGRSQGKQFDYEGKSDFQKEETKRGVQGSGSSLDACFTQSKTIEEIHRHIASKLLPNGAPSDCPASSIVKLNNQYQERHTSEDSPCSNAISVSVSTSGTSPVEGTTESCISSSTPTEVVPPKNSSLTSKEFKLNPGAKVFCPSFANHRSVTPPAVPTVANVPYVPDNFPVVSIASAQPEVEISSFVPRSSLPVKLVPYGNLIAENGISDSRYSQPIIGHVGSRTQPARYVGQHHSIQAGPAYNMHPNSQNVMLGRLGQLIYMHPVSHDVNQGVAAFSQVSTRPLLTTHQGHFPKHQGSAAAQALQLCVTPPFMAGGQQPFPVHSHIPLPQPPFSVIRPIPVPGSTGIFSTKFP